MKRTGAVLLALLLLLLPLQSLALEGYARFGKGSNAIVWPFQYEDSYFDTPGTSYQHALAQASLGMALSAFRKADVPLEESHGDIKTFFEELGFEQPLFSHYHLQPSISTIATAMAHKKLGAYTLLAVAVSGGGYKDEWKSNFSIGDSAHHIGFDSAAQQVLQRVSAYLSQHRLRNHRVKIWVSGYSRAAATSNRLGALLQDERLVRPEDLYVYTFATPNVTKQEDAPSYQSIYNIVGAFDPVPMVPFADWGFTRYGQTFVLPAPQINSDYVKRVAPVALLHLRYTGTPYWSNLSGISAVGKLLSSLSESVRDTQEYTEKLQPLLMDLWAKRNSRLGMLTTFISHFTLKEESLSGVLRNFFSIISNSLGESMLQGEGAFAPQWQEDKSLRDNLAREHFPEGYMAWVSAYSTLEEMRTPTLVYRQLALDGFDKVEVRDEEGNIVASLGFEEGEIVHGPEGSLTFTQVGNELELNLPADQDMRVSLRAMGGVLAFLRVKEGQAGYTRMQVYETGDLTPREGETFQLTLPRLTGQAEAGASVYQLAGTQRGFALTHQPNAQALSAQEMNSTFTSMFTQNLATGIAVMLLVFILLLFTILLSVRGLRRSMYKRRLRKCGTPLARAPLRGNFLNRKQPFKIPVKLFGLLVFGTGLAIAVAAVRVGLSWVREIQFIQQRTMFLFSLMYYVPFLVLLVCCAFPAIYAGGYALLWLSDLYMLRTSRLHARIGFLFSLGLGAVMTLPSYGYFSRILLYAVPLQILFLLLLLSMLRRAIKRNRKLDQAAEKTENSHNNEAENQAIVLDK